MSKINPHKKYMYGASEIFLDKVTTVTATADGTTTGVIATSDEIVHVTGVTGQTAYYAVLPDPATVATNKTFLIIGKSFASKLAVGGTSKKINGIAGQGTVGVGIAYLVRKFDADNYVAIGMTVA
jgi:hypothetical protein